MSASFTEYRAEERFAAAPERIWAILADLDHPGLAEGFVRAIEVEGDGAGAVRTFRMLPEHGGGSVAERITEFDAASMRYVYEVFDFGPLPYAAFEGRVQVAPDGPGAATLRYQARFKPAGDATESACLAERDASIGIFFRNMHRLVG